MARVIVTIEADGTTTFKVEGVAGPSCTNLTAALQKAVGKTVSDRKTSEYFDTAEVTERRVVSE